MSGVTNYSNNSVNYRYRYVGNASGTSGASGASAIESFIFTSGVSGSSGVSVIELSIDNIVNLFTHGNLEVSEIEKWLSAHKRDITSLETSTENGMIKYTFTYKGKDYSIACSEKAAASQMDKVTQNTFYSLSYLKQRFTERQLAQYFVLADSRTNQYVIRPDCGHNFVDILKEVKSSTINDLDNLISNLFYPMNAGTAVNASEIENLINILKRQGKLNQDEMDHISNMLKKLQDKAANMIVDGNYENNNKYTDLLSIISAMKGLNTQPIYISFKDAITKIEDLYNQSNGSLSYQDLSELIDLYFNGKLTNLEKKAIINEIEYHYNNQDTYENNTGIEITNDYEYYDKLKKQKEELIKNIADIISRITSAIATNSPTKALAVIKEVPDLIIKLTSYMNNISGRASIFSDSINKMNYELSEKLTNMQAKINEAKQKYSTNDSFNEIDTEGINISISTLSTKLTTVNFDEINNVVNDLFVGRETVTADELLNYLEDLYGSKNYKLKDDDYENSEAIVNVSSSRATSVDLVQEMDDEVIQAIEAQLNIDLSNINISYYTLAHKLKEMFEGRTDITKAELKSAIKSIYLAEYYKNKVEVSVSSGDYNYDKEENTAIAIDLNELKKPLQALIDEAILKCSDSKLASVMPIVTGIVGNFAEILSAIINGDMNALESAINNLKENLEKLRSELLDILGYDISQYKKNDDEESIYDKLVNELLTIQQSANSRQTSF